MEKKSIENMFRNIFNRVRDTGWQAAVLTDDFQYYDGTSQFKYRRVGKTVELVGFLKPTKTLEVSYDSRPQITTLPAGFRPAHQIVQLCQGSGTAIFTARITVSGAVTIERNRNMESENGVYGPPMSETAWIPINIMFITDNAFPDIGGGLRRRSIFEGWCIA